MSLLLLLAACGCPDFDDIELVDATSSGLSEAELDDLWATIDWFEASTGLAGVCVDEVQVEDDVSMWYGDVLGSYNGYANRIRVDRDDAPQTLAHELCHAVDDTLGNVSLERPDLFEPEAVAPGPGRRTRSARIREAFARSCEYVHLDDTRRRALYEHCGVPYEDPTLEWYRDEVFVAYTPEVTRQVDFAPLPRLQPHDLGTITAGRPLRAVASTDDHVVLVWHPVPAVPAHDPDLDPLTLAFVAPHTGTEAARVELMLDTPAWLTLLHGPDAVTLVLTDYDMGMTALRIGPDGILDRRALPDVLRGPPEHGGETDEGVLWLAGRDSLGVEEGCGVVTWDPSTDQVQACPPGLADQGVFWSGEPVASPDGWLLPLYSDHREAWILASPETGVPRPMNGGPRRLAVTADDHLWVLDTDYLAVADLPTAGLGRWDADGDRLTLAPDICTGRYPSASWIAHAGGAAWLVEDPDGTGSDLRLEHLPL